MFPGTKLKTNHDKTEHTVLGRDNRNTESLRNVKNIGSLGDSEETIRRKQLTIASMNKLQKMWIRRDVIFSESRRLKLYKALVKPVLTCNCGTWSLTKNDEDNIDTFHRKQLKFLIHKRFPHICINEYPLSLFILRSRLKLFGHILRLDEQTPAYKAMVFYFEKTDAKGFRGRPRTTIAAAINNDIKRTPDKIAEFPVRVLTSLENLKLIRELAWDRNVWSGIVKNIHKVAEDEKSH